ncbi:MAG: amidohydrolase [Candidatus Puniceispirillaceae bacterium]
MAGLLREGIDHEGVPLDETGLPTGELKGPQIMMPAGKAIGLNKAFLSVSKSALENYGQLCVRAGITTSADLGLELDDDVVSLFAEVTGKDDYPVCLVAFRINFGITPNQIITDSIRYLERSTPRLELGKIKVVADGSIQGFSARMNWPGYYNGAPNGLWYIAPEQLTEIYQGALEHGLQVHIHTNGDEATDMAIEMLEIAGSSYGARDHRFTLQHCQLASRAQFRKMARLGMCVNLFANHHYFWGDQHYNLTVGPERANRMNACRTALDEGVMMAIHSDAPVTPLGPLFTAQSAITRMTATGRCLGKAQAISVEEALYAITMGAAETMKMDHEIGSIEVGKRADFAILTKDPLTCPVDELADIPVWGTVQGGRIFDAQSRA